VPATIAAVVVDCEDHGSPELVRFSQWCEAELESNVGIDEARLMIEAEAGALAIES
jgi:hypothetical protein